MLLDTQTNVGRQFSQLPTRPLLAPQQGVLFPSHDPSMRRATPAEMTPEAFRDDPATRWHGNYRDSWDKVPEEGYTQSSSGVHAGTKDAALDRLAHQGYPNPAHGPIDHIDHGFLHPLREDRSVMSNSESDPDSDQGDRWSLPRDYYGQKQGLYYTNTAEDQGSTSVVVPRRDNLRTQGDFVDDARATGKPVHPRTAAWHDLGVLDKPEMVDLSGDLGGSKQFRSVRAKNREAMDLYRQHSGGLFPVTLFGEPHTRFDEDKARVVTETAPNTVSQHLPDNYEDLVAYSGSSKYWPHRGPTQRMA